MLTLYIPEYGPINSACDKQVVVASDLVLQEGIYTSGLTLT